MKIFYEYYMYMHYKKQSLQYYHTVIMVVLGKGRLKFLFYERSSEYCECNVPYETYSGGQRQMRKFHLNAKNWHGSMYG